MQPSTSWHDLLHPGDATDFFSRRPFPTFDPDANGYNRGNSLWLAELSRLVYRHDTQENNPPPQPTRTTFLVNAGFRQRQFFLAQETDTQAMLIESTGTTPFAVLVFRGTENVKDFLTDLEIGKFSLQGYKSNLHEGFAEALNSIWSDIDAELAQLTCPVFYTGHSLGAALATLAAARRTPKALYTFGSPRVGSPPFVAPLSYIPIYRIVDDEDVVTTLPPDELGFQHVGTEYRLFAPDNKFALQHLFNPPKPLADHAPINYVDRI